MRSFYSSVVLVVFTAYVALFSFSLVVEAQNDDELEQLLQEINNELEAWSNGDAEVEVTADVEEHDAADEVAGSVWAYDDARIELLTDEVMSTEAMLQTTTARFEWTAVAQYRVYYATRSIQTADPMEIMDVVVDVDKREGVYSFFVLTDLTPDTQYFVVVAPVHPENPDDDGLDMITEEITFTTAAEVTANDEQVMHNVSYTYAENVVTLTWTPSSSAQSVEVQIRHQGETSYETLGSASMADGSFSFNVVKEGNYFIKMIAKDAAGNAVGQEHVQTIKIDTIVAPAQPIETPPTVGAATDALVGMLILWAVVYFVYRFRRTS